MKRSLRKGSIDVYQSWRNSVLQTQNADSNELEMMIAAKVDEVLTVTGRRDPTVTLYYPQSKLITVLQQLEPVQTQVRTQWSGLHQLFEETPIFKWKFTEKNQFLFNLFGDCFKEQYYPSSEGKVNFAEKQGGKIAVLITKEQPIILSYKTSSQEVTINFHLNQLYNFFLL